MVVTALGITWIIDGLEVTLVDIDLGGESGLDVARRLSAVPSPPPIILISTHDEQDFAGLIAASPAIGFLSKMDLSAVAIRSLLGGVAGQRDQLRTHLRIEVGRGDVLRDLRRPVRVLLGPGLVPVAATVAVVAPPATRMLSSSRRMSSDRFGRSVSAS